MNVARVRQKVSGGYTIIEVLIVLAISTMLLFSAIAVFKGQQGETEFTQAVQDLNSKIISLSNQVSASTFSDSNDYNCAPGVGAPPVLSSGIFGQGSRQGCIFLGRALQIETISGSKLNIYTVVGNQTDSSGNTATSINTSNPTVATLGSAGPFIMNDTYTLAGGATFKSVAAYQGGAALGGTWAMAGIYTDLNGSSSSTVGNLQLDLLGYPLPSSGNSQVKTCVEGSTCISSNLSKWDLCVQNAQANHTMLLSVSDTSSGLTTQLTDGGC